VAGHSPLLQILRTPPAAPAPQESHGPAAVAWPAVVERMRAYAAARTLTAAAERCEFCGVEIAERHGHLVDLPRRALLCVCRPCYLLFTHDGAGALRQDSERPEQRSRAGVRFRAVPDRYVLVPDFTPAGTAWDALLIPVGLAFFFRSSTTGRMTGFYPSPAGATESELPMETWPELVRSMPTLATLAPDVEALLVLRADDRAAAVIVPIDACYELVGRIRRSWRGFQGGDEVWREIDQFFARVAARACGSPP